MTWLKLALAAVDIGARIYRVADAKAKRAHRIAVARKDMLLGVVTGDDGRYWRGNQVVMEEIERGNRE